MQNQFKPRYILKEIPIHQQPHTPYEYDSLSQIYFRADDSCPANTQSLEAYQACSHSPISNISQFKDTLSANAKYQQVLSQRKLLLEQFQKKALDLQAEKFQFAQLKQRVEKNKLLKERMVQKCKALRWSIKQGNDYIKPLKQLIKAYYFYKK